MLSRNRARRELDPGGNDEGRCRHSFEIPRGDSKNFYRPSVMVPVGKLPG